MASTQLLRRLSREAGAKPREGERSQALVELVCELQLSPAGSTPHEVDVQAMSLRIGITQWPVGHDSDSADLTAVGMGVIGVPFLLMVSYDQLAMTVAQQLAFRSRVLARNSVRTMALTPGTRIGSYEILEPLGSGGMGEVYRARDGALSRDVAIKVLPERSAFDPEMRARFEREAQAAARLSHPNILAIHDFGTDQGVLYAVTELLHGETLRGHLDRAPFAWRRALHITAAVAEGLAAAHAKGVIHRDLKPANLFLTSEGHVKILDFGLAQLAPIATSEEATAQRGLTQSGVTMGTAAYMSPEQVRSSRVDARTDIFSLGSVLYEMVSGQPAFARPTPAETMAAILNAYRSRMRGSPKL